VLRLGDSLLPCGVHLTALILGDLLLFCCLDVGVAATAASVSEVPIIHCR
jgi:hypothetical protein